MAEEAPQLTPVGEKSLPAKCKPSTLAYCPTMDLIALATEDEELRIYRLNGQRVFGGSFGGDPYLGDDEEDGEVRAVAWKGNGTCSTSIYSIARLLCNGISSDLFVLGRFLAVACGDGTLRIMSAYSGKVVHHYAVYKNAQEEYSNPDAKPVSPKVTCLGWGVNFTDSKAAQKHLLESAGQIGVEDLLAPGVHPSKAAALLKADLPRELALLDIENSLPKLSTLPATGTDDGLFSSRASIDAMFHSSAKDASDSVDVLFVGFDDGSVHLRIFDCFEIGSFPVSESAGVAGSRRILRYASHPLSSTHALLASGSAGTPLDLVTLDLRFITKSGRYLSLLASKTTQLHNLLRYIGSVQRQIELEWKNAQELPARFLRSVNEDLQEKNHCDFVTAIYHLVVTGHCYETIKEFLVDIVGERGHKRWEKAVSGGYEAIRRLTHECLLPALDRSQVLLSRLVGLSKFHKLSDVLGLKTHKLSAIVETLDCLQLLAHSTLINANEELDQFNAFSRWLRHEILILNAEPLSQTAEELLEKRDLFDVPPTVKYITGALRKSVLRNFIRQLPMIGVPQLPTPDTDKWLPGDHERSFYDTFKSLLAKQRRVQAEGGDSSTVDAPKLNDLTKRLGIQFDKVFAEIALTQRRGILHRSPLTLHADCDQSILDVKICHEDGEEGRPCSIYLAARSTTSKSLIYIYRLILNSSNGVSSTRSTSMAALNLQEGEIKQLQFVEDDTLMILWSTHPGPSYLLNLPFQPPSANCSSTKPDQSSSVLEYTQCDPHPSSSKPSIPATLLNVSALCEAGMVRHVFATSGLKAKPVSVDVNGRRGRRAVCVLYGDSSRYDVLDLDAAIEGEEEEGLEGEGESVVEE
ncbi:Anaphase-promoting complex subunit 4 [Penicillium verhagenii]|uniref:Anaphase-promoting complex subunit 4 n=1 Tax=Penicillium verhagenii TaxID=1562060 RepID=UPI002544F5DE|nr:Anaphase-promoting complex subunit 4 [Penicillium verhagenii]KAJ5948177.1 Anaphase-promoting complex subunit 4 [Penicillium verhagenii]